MKLQFADFVSWAFLALIAFSFRYAAKALGDLREDIKGLSVSIAVEAEKNRNQDHRLDRLEERSA